MIRRETPAPAQLVQVGDQLVHVERAGTGEAVVLLHGFGASAYSWRKVMLAATHRVVAIDLNGFGPTERPKAQTRYTREAQAAVLQLPGCPGDRAPIHRPALRRPHLYLAQEHPERFRTMVLVDSSAPITPTTAAAAVFAVDPWPLRAHRRAAPGAWCARGSSLVL